MQESNIHQDKREEGKKGRPPIRWLDSVKGGEITHKSEANGKA
jgi:hypothetical protein